MLGTLSLHSAYREAVTVAGGIRLGIRMIQPADKQKLVDGFQRLSMESRYLRFFSPKNALSPAELSFFTECDGVNHVAIGAFELTPAGTEGALVGVARFIRFQENAEVAEFSLAVVDDRQGLGIGRLLLEHLLTLAVEGGIKHFHGYLLAENYRVRQLLSRVCKDATFHNDGSMVTVKLPVLDLAANMTLMAQPGLLSSFGRLLN